jgi:hypothetical protein
MPVSSGCPATWSPVFVAQRTGRRKAVVTRDRKVAFGEAALLVYERDTPTVEVHALVAPYVTAWNIGELDENGNPVPVPAPADGDPTVFEHVPNEFFFLFREIKLFGTKRLNPKPVTPVEPTDEP